MEEFTHQQLQAVIRKYHHELMNMKELIVKKNYEIETLNNEIDRSTPEDLDMYKEENQRLKDYMNKLNQENEELKSAQKKQDDLTISQVIAKQDSNDKNTPVAEKQTYLVPTEETLKQERLN